jgi:hypothetical protein
MEDEVSRREVMAYWCRREAAKDDESLDVADLTDAELANYLIETLGGTERILWATDEVTWCRTTLDERTFRDLRILECPDGSAWRRLALDEAVFTAAERILADDLDGVDPDLVDVAHVRSLADRLPDADIDELILSTGQSTTPPRVVDGNHRATAMAVHVLRGGEYQPMDAYLGLERTRVLRPALDKARWYLRRLARGRRP